MVPLLAALALVTQLPEPIRVTTRLVEVNVIARDKNGPVSGLTRDDFILRDRGRVQQIVAFRADTRTEPASVTPLPPGEFTNVGSSDRAIVIVWDHLNTNFEDAASGRKQVLKADLQFDEADYRAFLSGKHVLNLAIPNPKPGRATLRLVVGDRASGRVGSITIPVR